MENLLLPAESVQCRPDLHSSHSQQADAADMLPLRQDTSQRTVPVHAACNSNSTDDNNDDNNDINNGDSIDDDNNNVDHIYNIETRKTDCFGKTRPVLHVPSHELESVIIIIIIVDIIIVIIITLSSS